MKFFNKVVWSKWKVIRTIWPYPEGYGIYRDNVVTGNRVILETGLTKEDAQYRCNLQNESKEK